MANASIYAAFERMWQHIVAKIGSDIESAIEDSESTMVAYVDESIDKAFNEFSTTYYSNLSVAITDINNGVTANALSDATNAKVKVFIDHTGVLTVMLLDDVSESVPITINKDIALALNGKVLNLTTNTAVLTFDVGTNCQIHGMVDGSAIIMDGVSITANTNMITSNGDSFEIYGGTYTMNVNGTNRAILFVTKTTCKRFEMHNAVVSVTGNGQCRAIQTQATEGTLLTGLQVNGISSTNYTYGVFSGGDVEMENCFFTIRGQTGAYGISTYAGYSYKITDSDINTITNSGQSYALPVVSNSVCFVKKTRLFSDAPDCHVSSDSYAIAINAEVGSIAHLTDCVCIGTHSGVNAHGDLYVNGGTYTGYCHGGLYAGNPNCNNYINDVTIRCGNYEGEFDYSEKAGEIYGAMYIGGGEGQNNITVYMDGCTIENTVGAHAIVLRGSDGEINNTVNISNTNIINNVVGIIRVDNDTLKVNIGLGGNITADNVAVDYPPTITNALYRRNYGDKVCNGNDFNAITNYLTYNFDFMKYAVLYSKQDLTSEQQAQARENIGGATIDDVLVALPRAEEAEF